MQVQAQGLTRWSLFWHRWNRPVLLFHRHMDGGACWGLGLGAWSLELEIGAWREMEKYKYHLQFYLGTTRVKICGCVLSALKAYVKSRPQTPGQRASPFWVLRRIVGKATTAEAGTQRQTQGTKSGPSGVTCAQIWDLGGKPRQ